MYDYPGTSSNEGNWFHKTNWKQAFINPVYEIHVKGNNLFQDLRGLLHDHNYKNHKSQMLCKKLFALQRQMDSECT